MSNDDAARRSDVDAFRRESAAVLRDSALAHLDTSEVRWFGLGTPPSDVLDWFTAGGTSATSEHRLDVYHLTGRHDVGTKRRSRHVLQVKVRESVGPSIILRSGLEGPFEEWRKWAPTEDDPMWPAADATEVDVNKQVLTRTFTLAGEEVGGPAAFDDSTFTGCDVEVAAVTVGAIDAWTFCFEAFGPRSDRRAAVRSAWTALTADTDPPDDLGDRLGDAAGYPEWLDATVARYGKRAGTKSNSEKSGR